MIASATLTGKQIAAPMANLTGVVHTTFGSDIQQLNRELGYNLRPVGEGARTINVMAQEIFTNIRLLNDATISAAMNTILNGDYRVTFHENGDLHLVSTNKGDTLLLKSDGSVTLNNTPLDVNIGQDSERTVKITDIYKMVFSALPADVHNSDGVSGTHNAFHHTHAAPYSSSTRHTSRTHPGPQLERALAAMQPAAQTLHLSELKSDLEGEERMIEELKGALSANQQRIQTPQMQDEQLDALIIKIEGLEREKQELTEANTKLIARLVK